MSSSSWASTPTRARQVGRVRLLAGLFLLSIGGRATAGGPVPLGPELPDVSHAGPLLAPCPPGAERIEPGQPIQAAVNRAPAGVAFCIGAGRHRGQTVAPKDRQRFFGEAGAVLDGTVDLTHFEREGGFWVALGPAPPTEPNGQCLTSAPTCNRPEIVLMDGLPLVRVLDRQDLSTGRFLIDAARRIQIADDPTGHHLAANAAAYAFVANGARDVTIANLTIERYGNPAQRGAVFGNQDPTATGWTVEHNEVRLNSGLGILSGPAARILANKVEDNGQLGISASLHDELIEGNTVSGNNTRGFDPEWEAGGIKTAVDTRLVVRNNDVHGNHGPGVWCDIDCRDVLYEGNLVEANEGAGIFYEISFSSVIRGNTVRNNGTSQQNWYWGANILLAASQDVLVENNRIVVADGGTGIALVDQGRRRESGGLYRTSGNKVVDNEIRFTGLKEARMGGVDDVPLDSPNFDVIEAGDNVFASNRYTTDPQGSVAFGWGRGPPGDFARFQALGQDKGSTMSTRPSE